MNTALLIAVIILASLVLFLGWMLSVMQDARSVLRTDLRIERAANIALMEKNRRIYAELKRFSTVITDLTKERDAAHKMLQVVLVHYGPKHLYEGNRTS